MLPLHQSLYIQVTRRTISITYIQCVFLVYFDPKKYTLKQEFAVFSLLC